MFRGLLSSFQTVGSVKDEPILARIAQSTSSCTCKAHGKTKKDLKRMKKISFHLF